MKQIIYIIILISSIYTAKSQQDPLISHVFDNKTFINPAFAGTQGEICANLINRQQWFGLEGAPKTTILNLNSPINIFGTKSGIGISLLDDKLGLEKNFTGMIDYSYHHMLGEGILSFGAQLGINNKAFEGTWTTPEISANADPAIPAENDHNLVFDMGFGIAYNIGNLYVGLSSTHLTQPSYNFTNAKLPFLKRHYYLISGYIYEIPNSLIELKPNVMLNSDGSSSQMLINVDVLYNKKFWGGVSYRTVNGIDIKIGVELLNGIRIGYSYGLNISEIIRTNSGSHELMLGYCFNLSIDKAPQKYRSVRFL
ncbi:MAG: type IX secretion system membrane protein PorP/SprF [Bacteroidales bacterium]|nr:type IX secretion system membrane protein PorP/SprF [Bacteroidales bacterium]MBN2755890.1 type IX secretion system membrane protein PorP/SprF [Bacteroidales bacterium]